MNIHLPAILGFTRYKGFDPPPIQFSSFLNLGMSENGVYPQL